MSKQYVSIVRKTMHTRVCNASHIMFTIMTGQFTLTYMVALLLNLAMFPVCLARKPVGQHRLALKKSGPWLLSSIAAIPGSTTNPLACMGYEIAGQIVMVAA